MARKIFEQAMMSSPKKSAFDLSHEHKTTTEFSKLTPIMNMEVVPGDQIAVNSEILVRMAPTIAPIMHRVDVFVHHFFVPNRIVWDKWEDFIFPKDDYKTPPTMPTVEISEQYSLPELWGTRSLANHLGFPVIDPKQLIDNIKVSSLPFRAYTAIYNDYYRDQNLEDELDLDSDEIFKIRYRAWEKDYFTSALPFAQKGPAVKIPGGSGSLKDVQLADQVTGLGLPNANLSTDVNSVVRSTTDPTKGGQLNFGESNMGTTIEDLRRSARLQEWLEKAARAGTRYKEGIKSFFGTNIGDARLDRPEYLGGGKQPITISEVLNTTGNISGDTTDQQPNVQGDMAGHGIAVGGKNNFKYSVKEHGHIISIMSIMPKPAYQQGIDKLWTRNDRFDYYWPEFANLGEQEIKNQELYVTADSATRDQTFGYQQKYAEYKYACDKVTGDFAGNLDFWHLGRKFVDQPYLNNAFIKPDVEEFERIFAVDSKTTGTDQFWCQIYHDVKARRPMPYFGTPRL